MAKNSTINIERLMRLEPISALSSERLEELAKLADVERVSIGVSLFREGDLDNQTLYLLQGDVQLSSSDGSFDEVISSRHNSAKFPLDDSQPRQVSCVALGLVEFLRVDNSVLDYMMMWDQLAVQEELLGEKKEEVKAEEEKSSKDETKNKDSENKDGSLDDKATDDTGGEIAKAKEEGSGGDKEQPLVEDKDAVLEQKMDIEKEPKVVESTTAEPASQDDEQAAVTEISSDKIASAEIDNVAPVEKGAWMRRMRHIMAFKNLPPANIKDLLDRMETVKVKKGETVVHQGESGDTFYVLTDGEAQVTRTIELAQLKAGASFGEESLVSGGQRNASITMMTDGVLMKLSKQDFDHLLKEPMLNRVSPEEAKLRALKGDIWLDVRHASEYHHSSLPKANNIPLHEIRMRMDELDKNKQYICYCNTGRRSSAAAFILAQAGFHVSVLNGGVRVMPQDLVRK
ncbi:hypothetical protein MNBD_GAMMA23-609 [hydrothermal vent metagenome]|uniref:Cyclic nucleotide-binding domain-containing protein n=1 Tax=hydrothermal vent metagenome TaxID=652676 RepID=A0A3B1ACT6_9ZZZZ